MNKQGSLKTFAGFAIVAVLAALAFCVSATASDLYAIQEDKPLDEGLRPAAGKALIYFMRPQSMGFAIKVKLYGDGKFLGIIMSKSFIAYECDPGKHEFVVEAENAGFLEAEVAAGKIYVVQVCIHVGAIKARTHFEVARPDTDALHECSKAKAALHAIETTEEGRTWAAKKNEDIQATIERYREKGKEFETLKPEDGYDALPWTQ